MNIECEYLHFAQIIVLCSVCLLCSYSIANMTVVGSGCLPGNGTFCDYHNRARIFLEKHFDFYTVLTTYQLSFEYVVINVSLENVTGVRSKDCKLAAERKDSKNDAARKFFGPSYFVTALGGALSQFAGHQANRIHDPLCYVNEIVGPYYTGSQDL